MGATLRDSGGAAVDVGIRELSTTGFAMEGDMDLGQGQAIWIGLNGGGIVAARVVRRMSNGWACEFSRPLGERQFEAALLAQSTVSTPWAGMDAGDSIEPQVARWPLPARAALIVGSSAALWALIVRMLL
jgi:hypothetical protein